MQVLADNIDFTRTPLERIKIMLSEFGVVSDSRCGSLMIVRCQLKGRPHFEIMEVATKVSLLLTGCNLQHEVSYHHQMLYFSWTVK